MSNLRIEGLSSQIQLDSLPGIKSGNASAIELDGSTGKVGGSGSFSDLLEKTISSVNEHQVEADHAIKELIAGRNKNIHEAMLAVERAEMSLKLMTQVRNKVLDAYKEIMRMQV